MHVRTTQSMNIHVHVHICTCSIGIYVRMSEGKKLLAKKNLEIKSSVKMSQFSEVLGQNVTGKKS